MRTLAALATLLLAQAPAAQDDVDRFVGLTWADPFPPYWDDFDEHLLAAPAGGIDHVLSWWGSDEAGEHAVFLMAVTGYQQDGSTVREIAAALGVGPLPEGHTLDLGCYADGQPDQSAVAVRLVERFGAGAAARAWRVDVPGRTFAPVEPSAVTCPEPETMGD